MLKSAFKWVIRLVAGLWLLALLLVGARLAEQNQQPVQVDLLLWQSPEVSLGLVICLALLAGVVLGLLAFMPSILMVRARLRRTQNKLGKAQHELQPQQRVLSVGG